MKTPPLPEPVLTRSHLTLEEFLILLYSPTTPKVRDLAPVRSRTRTGRGIVIQIGGRR